MLDQLFADERRDIRMKCNVIDGRVQVLICSFSCGQLGSAATGAAGASQGVQQCFASTIMPVLKLAALMLDHRVTVVRYRRDASSWPRQSRRINPTRKHPSKFRHGFLIIGGDGVATGVHSSAPV